MMRERERRRKRETEKTEENLKENQIFFRTKKQKEEKRKFLARKRELETQGFTMVTEDDTNPHRRRGRDSYGTVVHGVT